MILMKVHWSLSWRFYLPVKARAWLHDKRTTKASRRIFLFSKAAERGTFVSGLVK
jgi:hypothetical protein